MLALQELKQGEGETISYPPSILMVGDNNLPTLKLKRWLEHNGCRVCQADPRSTGSATSPQPYFDFVVLNLEGTAGDEVEVCRKLAADPELAHLPVVVLTPPGCPLKAIPGLKMDQIYCLARTRPGGGTICAETMLLQLIQQTHYLIDRYT